MPTILIKKSDTPSAVPTGSDLTNLAGGAEIAVNTADKRVFSMNSSSAIIELGTNPGSLTTADASATVFRSGSATITNLIATTATVSDLSATVSRIGSGTVTQLTSTSASITTLTATSASVTNLTATSLVLSNLSIASANVTTLTSGSATITNLLATSLTVSSGSTLNGGVVVNETGADVDFRIEGDTDANLLFVDASTDRVGVGTNTPTVKMDILGGGSEGQLCLSTNATDATTKEAKLVVRHYTNSEENFMVLYPFSTATDNSIYYGGGSASQNAATGHFWSTAANNTTTSGTVRMTLNSAGNLGLGVTPSAWAGGRIAIQLDGGAFLQGRTGGTLQTVLGNNYYHDGTGFKYIATGSASAIDLSAGGCAWYIAGSGSAGASVSLTQAMTLDASGNLGVGITSPSDPLSLGNGLSAGFNADSSGQTTRLRWRYTGTEFAWIERVHADGSLAFGVQSAERARITSGGELLVGTTSTTPNPGVAIFPTGGMGQGNSAGGSGFEFNSFRRSAVQIGSITQNGTTAVAYNTSSDRRLKENITAAPEAGAKIDAIEIVSHDWKSAPDEHVEFGVVAQDLYAVAPQAVSVGDDGEEVEKTWGVDYSKLVPMLVKEIQSLRARVAALEGAN